MLSYSILKVPMRFTSTLLICITLALSACNQTKPENYQTRLYKILPPSEQQVVRLMIGAINVYEKRPDYGTISNTTLRANLTADPQPITDLRPTDLVGVHVHASDTNAKIAVFHVNTPACKDTIGSLRNSLIDLDLISEPSQVQCSDSGYTIHSNAMH